MESTDGMGADAGESGTTRWLTVSLALSAGLLLGASGLLWLEFGSQVFLDAAANLWKTCF